MPEESGPLQHLASTRRLTSLAGMVAVSCTLAGCVTEGPPLPPAPRPPPPQAADAKPDHIVSSAPQVPEDTDRNGFYDQISVTIYLFDDRYRTPIDVPGSFTFTLTDEKGKALATWK